MPERSGDKGKPRAVRGKGGGDVDPPVVGQPPDDVPGQVDIEEVQVVPLAQGQSDALAVRRPGPPGIQPLPVGDPPDLAGEELLQVEHGAHPVLVGVVSRSCPPGETTGAGGRCSCRRSRALSLWPS